MGESLRIILSLAATSMMALAIVAAQPAAFQRHARTTTTWRAGRQPRSRRILASRTYHSSAWCSDSGTGLELPPWRSCKFYVPYTNTHHSDDWSSWDEEGPGVPHWKVRGGSRRAGTHERLDDRHCRTLPEFSPNFPLHPKCGSTERSLPATKRAAGFRSKFVVVVRPYVWP